MNRLPFITDEWYHCFNRGTEKRAVFLDRDDYERYMALLYICNGTKPTRISDRRNATLPSILGDETLQRGEPLVDIGAYSLMPNHTHTVLKQLSDGGIAKFMQRVYTGYTMYFNLKYERTGALFSGVFKSRHIDSDDYLQVIVPYVLLNPAELFEPKWKKGVANIARLEQKLLTYPYSSAPDFFERARPEGKIVGKSLFDWYVRVSIKDLLREAQKQYQEAGTSASVLF